MDPRIVMPFSTRALKRAFDAVADPADWRNPIDAMIPAGHRDVTAAAIDFYTATPASFADVDGDFFNVTAVGYRNGPAGP